MRFDRERAAGAHEVRRHRRLRGFGLASAPSQAGSAGGGVDRRRATAPHGGVKAVPVGRLAWGAKKSNEIKWLGD